MSRRLAEAPGGVQRGRPADVIAEQAIELCPERGIAARLDPRLLELGQGRHQRLGDVLAPVGAEAVLDRAHRAALSCAPVTAAANASSFCGSFRPGLNSTPLATSTA